MLRQIGALWRGEIPLYNAFWDWAVIGGLAVNIVTTLVFLALVMSDQRIAALLVGYGLAIPYNIVAGVGVWRAADRYRGGDPRLPRFARAVSLVGLTILSLT
jgi:hypothetical protein